MKRRVLPRFVAMIKPYWFSKDKWIARGLLALLIVLLLGNTAFSVLLNEQSGEFTSALASQNTSRYWTSIYKTIGDHHRCCSVLRVLLLRSRQARQLLAEVAD